MSPEIALQFTQFGTAGLIAWMWLTERRAAASRERQLAEAHERLMEQRVQIDALMRLVGESVRATASLEEGQRALRALLERAIDRRQPSRPEHGPSVSEGTLRG